jgi:hypothetical protein
LKKVPGTFFPAPGKKYHRRFNALRCPQADQWKAIGCLCRVPEDV